MSNAAEEGVIASLESWSQFTDFLRGPSASSSSSQQHQLVVVDFYSPWCGPCMRIEADLHRLAASLRGRVRFARVDVEQVDDLANAEGIQAMPTFRLYRGGEPVATVVGSNLALLVAQIEALK